MKKPEMWRKLKVEEYKQIQAEEKKQRDIGRQDLPKITED